MINPAIKSLSKAERKVTRLICRGLMNKQISHVLCRDDNTVATHINRIRRKLKARTRTQIVLMVYGLENVEPPL